MAPPSPIEVAILVGIVGLVMFVRGMRVRRRGDTPHCRACEYTLTGLSDRSTCPECGAALGRTDAVVYGERYRRTRLAVAGGLVLLIAITPLSIMLIAGARDYDWIRWRPASWVLNDLERSNSISAATELARRYQAGTLSASNRDRFIELALAEQARPSGGGTLPSTLVQFLSDAEANGDLSPEQQVRFYEQMVILTLTTGSPVAAETNLPFTIREACRTPGGAWWVRIILKNVELVAPDGATVKRQDGSGESRLSGLGAGGSTGSSLRVRVPPGKYTLRARLKGGAYKGPMTSIPSIKPAHEWEVTLTQDVVVVAPK